jgi:uncharacterized damage-inducible protein DinB
MPKQPRPSSQPAQSAFRIFAANERINQLLIEHLDRAVWTARTPGNVRSIAAIFTHMHNVRAKWIRLTAPHLKIPAQLNRAHCTPQQARRALAESAARCEEMLAAVAAETTRAETTRAETTRKETTRKEKRIPQFVRDGWAKPWPAGPALLTDMLSYMLAHEAHHRGQVAMLTHQLGHPLPKQVISDMWNWEKLWK